MADAIALAREKLAAKFGDVRTGGKGTVRRKKKAAHKANGADDKKLSATLKKLGVTNIPGVEEVNLFKADGQVIHFASPKVQASIASNTFAVSGHSATKSLQELLPGIINQLGPDNLANLKQIAESYSAAQKAAKGAAPMKGAGAKGAGAPKPPYRAASLYMRSCAFSCCLRKAFFFCLTRSCLCSMDSLARFHLFFLGAAFFFSSRSGFWRMAA